MTEIASHRGGALLWPENSRTAFENTAKLALEQVEFDVHPTKDDRLVVIHDATLDRTTDGTGPVCARTLGELSAFTLKGTSADRILLLDEVIDIFAPTPLTLRLEIKPGPGRVPYRGLPRNIANRLRDRGVLQRSVVTSFQLETVCEAAAHAMPQKHVFLVTPDAQTDLGLAGVIAAARSRGVPMIGLRWDRIDAAVVDAARGAGLGIGGWAVNDDGAIAHMLALSVDVFTSDRPDRAIAARNAHRARARASGA